MNFSDTEMAFLQYEVLIYKHDGTVHEFKLPYNFLLRYLFDTLKEEFLKPGTE